MSEPITPRRDDRLGLQLSLGAAAVGAVATVVTTVRRLIDVAPGHDIPVTVPLNGESVGLPIGPDGAAVTATVDAATVIVADPAPATLFALWAQPIWTGLAVLAGLAIACVLFLRIARGTVFNGGASRLVYAAAVVVMVGWFGGSMLTNMTTNGALSAISDYTYDSTIFSLSLVPSVAVLVLGALGVALQIGERLQKDTEGLV